MKGKLTISQTWSNDPETDGTIRIQVHGERGALPVFDVAVDPKTFGLVVTGQARLDCEYTTPTTPATT